MHMQSLDYSNSYLCFECNTILTFLFKNAITFLRKKLFYSAQFLGNFEFTILTCTRFKKQLSQKDPMDLLVPTGTD